MTPNSRRNLLQAGLAAVAAGGAVQAQTAPAKLEKKVHGPKPKKTPLFSRAVSYGNLLFVSGIGAHVPGDIKVHTKIVLDELKAALESAGSSMDKVLKCNVYLADLRDYDGMNEVFRGSFGEEPPVRTTVSVAGVPGKSLVEIDVIACI
jgi:2-iminobutanoate/2-iminopropanoate deaminase